MKTSNTAVGLVIPEEIVSALSRNKRPNVQVTLNGRATWWTTLSVRPEGCLVRVTGEQCGTSRPGDEVDVDLVLDTGLRALPGDLALALSNAPRARDAFERLPDKQAWLDWVVAEPNSRARNARVAAAVAALESGRRPF